MMLGFKAKEEFFFLLLKNLSKSLQLSPVERFIFYFVSSHATYDRVLSSRIEE
jgi:hypothetical protein